ncbi:concanavalin A-like lectin/glucanase [Thozetella sp. PMI_491]|nr:concanavalin A-like lectin/glucanase [Thozetella sp. PMI_491]
MLLNTFAGASVVLGLSTLVHAQAVAKCNLAKAETCDENPAFGGDASFDFSSVSTIHDLESFWKVDDGVKYKNETLKLGENGGNFVIYTTTDAPTLTTNNYIFFGKVEVTLQAAPGQGIISSVVLMSDDLDEIDWEFVGTHNYIAETNFYYQGTENYTHGLKVNTSYDITQGIHTYTIDWTPDYITFSIDNNLVRTVTPADAADNGKQWPQTPAQVKLGTWIGGLPGKSHWTIEWAGGEVDWVGAPYTAIYKDIKITDYGGGYSGATKYSYGDGSGTWKSIKVEGGKPAPMPSVPGEARPTPSTTSSAAPTSTSSTASAVSTTSTSTADSKTTKTSSTGVAVVPTPSSNSTTTGPPSTVPTNAGTKFGGAFNAAGLLALLFVFLL